MFGFVFAGLCIIGLVFVLSRPRRFRGHRGGGHGCRRHGPWGGMSFRHGGLHRVLDRLDTTPGQEKVIRSAVEDLVDKSSAEAAAIRAARAELAAIVSEENFDRERASAWMRAQEERLEHLGSETVAALGRIHEVLDERQRRTFGRIIEAGPWARRFGH